MKVAITGSSGLIGSALLGHLREAGHQGVRLVRHAPPPEDAERAQWSPSSAELETDKVDGADAVVHLAGENIVGRWTEGKKERIRRSRVVGTANLARALTRLDRPPKAFLSGSAIGFYGDRGDEALTEESPLGKGFLADVAQAWEGATELAKVAGIRTVLLRTGLVLSGRGGALSTMLRVFRLGLGGRIGSGKQMVSWITLEDWVRAVEFLLHREIAGPVNLTSPSPVSNAELTRTLGAVLGRPTPFPLPAFAARLAMREMADELLLTSQRVYPERLQNSGFEWRHPSIDAGVRAAIARP